MSKRLKLISASEAEMEERCFPNPYPDWDQGALSSTSGSDPVPDDPFDAEGKVKHIYSLSFFVYNGNCVVYLAAS